MGITTFALRALRSSPFALLRSSSQEHVQTHMPTLQLKPNINLPQRNLARANLLCVETGTPSKQAASQNTPPALETDPAADTSAAAFSALHVGDDNKPLVQSQPMNETFIQPPRSKSSASGMVMTVAALTGAVGLAHAAQDMAPSLHQTSPSRAASLMAFPVKRIAQELITSANSAQYQTHHPLRIVRGPGDEKLANNDTGRLVISGRMADVCAELDRLVACELAAVH